MKAAIQVNKDDDTVVVAIRMTVAQWKLIHRGIGKTPPIELAVRMRTAVDTGPTVEERDAACRWYNTLYLVGK